MSELEREQYMLNTPTQCRLRAELMRKGIIKFDDAEEVTDMMYPNVKIGGEQSYISNLCHGNAWYFEKNKRLYIFAEEE